MGNGGFTCGPSGASKPAWPRALYLGDTLYRIHGTNRPGSIGGAVSHGCFRMHNPHIIELYEKCRSELTSTSCLE